MQELVLADELLHFLHAWHIQQQLEIVNNVNLLLSRVIDHLAGHVLALKFILELELESVDGELQQLLEVAQVALQLCEDLQLRLL